MAQQHLYSRVPARMSIFNKADGFDTFAYSDGISQKFIESELAAVYDNKPSKEDADLVLKGKLPPVFCQRVTDEGKLIQSVISFLQKDYTGERSAYLVHSLVLSEEEKKQAIFSKENNAFNAKQFRYDINDIDMTSFDAAPDSDYPAKELVCEKATDFEYLKNKYDSIALKRILFAVLQLACGKTRSVYIALPEPLENMSSSALEFMNALLQIMPYHIRPLLSFVTYLSDSSKFNAYKIKFVPESFLIPSQKGLGVRIRAREAIGFTDETVNTNIQVVNFFYGLLENDAIRREFVSFCDYAVSKTDTLEKPSVKNIYDLVFLFLQCSGRFQEAAILPNDDKVYEFVTVYDKMRTFISDEYRAQALKCLLRYSNKNIAIPKNIFNKVSNMYPTEPVASRRTVMNIALDLIHTDSMREKLFTFIKNNYQNEDEGRKAIICDDLARVYYGGFLQAPILNFFVQNYDSEPEATRDIVVEKLLLTIRTNEVQNGILEFFDNRYDGLTQEQKGKFYQTFYAMLAECDDLAQKLLDIVNKHIVSEDETLCNSVAEKLFELIEKNQRRNEPKMIPMLIRWEGFATEVTVKKIFNSWSGKKAFTTYINAICESPIDVSMKNIATAWKLVPDMSEELAQQFFDGVAEGISANTKRNDLFVIVDGYNTVYNELVAQHKANASKFGKRVLEKCILPKLIKAIPDALNYKAHPDGISDFSNFASDKPEITKSEEYKYIKTYFNTVEAFEKGEVVKAISFLEEYREKVIRVWVAENLQAQLVSTHFPQESIAMSLYVVIEYLRSGEVKFNDAFRRSSDAISAEVRSKLNNASNEQIAFESEKQSLLCLLTVGENIFISDIAEEKKAAAVSENSEFASIIVGFIQRQGKKGSKFIDELLIKVFTEKEYQDIIKKISDKAEPKKNGGLFSKLFKK